jgi:hypothetical protein
MSQELEDLNKLHADKTGSVNDISELPEAIRVFEAYSFFTERHEGVVMPTVEEIIEIVQIAEDRMINANKPVQETEEKVVEAELITSDGCVSKI